MKNKEFKIEDKTGRKIYLTRERKAHIKSGHPRVSMSHLKQSLYSPL